MFSLNGARIALFLDDGWGRASTRDTCAFLSKTVKDYLLSAGFVSNDDKSGRVVLGFACDPLIPLVQFASWIFKVKRLNVVN